MIECPDCGYRQPSYWRPSRWDPYQDYCWADDFKGFEELPGYYYWCIKSGAIVKRMLLREWISRGFKRHEPREKPWPDACQERLG